MLNLITTGVTYLFPGGRALKLVKNGINVTNSTNPLILTKNITLMVVDYLPLCFERYVFVLGIFDLILISRYY